MNAPKSRRLTISLGRSRFAAVVTLILLIACNARVVVGQENYDRQGSGDAAPTSGEWCSTRINITALRKRLAKECGLHGENADQWVRQHAKALVTVDDSEAEKESEEPAGGQRISLSIDGDDLVIAGPQQSVDRVEKSVERIGETGIAQIVMRLSVYQGPAAEMERLRIRWAHVSTSTEIATDQDSDGTVAQASYNSSQLSEGVTLAGMMLNKKHPRTLENVLTTRLNETLVPSRPQTGKQWIEASSIVELGTPVLYTMMAPDEVQSVVEQAGASETIDAVSSTLVAVYNGNPTQINNVVERPFVTAVKPRRIVTDGESTLVFEPRTKVYPVGFRFIVRPTLIDGTQIQLTCVAEQFSVQKVRTMDIPVAGETERTIRVQMPTAAKSSIHAQLAIPKNFALALSTESLDTEGKPLTTLFVCQCGSKQLRDDAKE